MGDVLDRREHFQWAAKVILFAQPRRNNVVAFRNERPAESRTSGVSFTVPVQHYDVRIERLEANRHEKRAVAPVDRMLQEHGFDELNARLKGAQYEYECAEKRVEGCTERLKQALDERSSAYAVLMAAEEAARKIGFP